MYSFYKEMYDGKVIVEQNLTKRQAIIRYNKALKAYDPEVQIFGWEEQNDILSHQIRLAKAS